MEKEDPEISEMVLKKLKEDGVEVKLQHEVTEFRNKDSKKLVVCEHQGEKVEISCDCILVAIGRKPNTEGFGLDELGVELNSNGTIKVDDYLRTTKFKNIYACGDVAGPFQFTHTASHQAWFCAVNSMVKPFWGFKADYRVIPWCTYTDPEVARVGLNETEAKEKGVEYDVTTYPIEDLDRAITEEAAYGVVKVLTKPGKDQILGVTIVGPHAGDIIAEYVAAMKHGFGMNKILGTIHIYPTLAEANKFAAGNWKRNQTSDTALAWGERLNRWRR
jgi:pyruvate/2-oxoglutarate dehydrogenase complex dihydrolipoamide dehydrogenase (E3) component